MTQADIVIVGAGIVGSSIAARLASATSTSTSSPGLKILLVDRDVAGLPGSTGHAPGFVGQLNTIPTLTELAKRSVTHYRTIPGGFNVVGGMEIAVKASGQNTELESGSGTQDAVQVLHDRLALATTHNLPATIINGSTAANLAPALIKPDRVAAGLHFPLDGTANARVITHHEQAVAKAAGAQLINAEVTCITPSEADGGYTLTTLPSPRGTPGQGPEDQETIQRIQARHVILCTGIWASSLIPTLTTKVVSVSHPYAYSVPHSQLPPSPFVRFPAQHVYARDHGTRFGIGTYDHSPEHVSAAATAGMTEAYGPWVTSFGETIERAVGLLPDETGRGFGAYLPAGAVGGDQVSVKEVATREVPYAFNGLFSVTPDAVPLVGRLSSPPPTASSSSSTGLWCAVGVWVTSAAGVAGVLADQVLEAVLDAGTAGEEAHKDSDLRKALDPLRFQGRNEAALQNAALSTYNDIYNKEKS